MNEGKYATSSGFLPVWRKWGDELALFDCNSGVTFLFDDITASVLNGLQPGPLALDDLVDKVAESLLFIVDEDLSRYIQSALTELTYKKLIVPAAE